MKVNLHRTFSYTKLSITINVYLSVCKTCSYDKMTCRLYLTAPRRRLESKYCNIYWSAKETNTHKYDARYRWHEQVSSVIVETVFGASHLSFVGRLVDLVEPFHLWNHVQQQFSRLTKCKKFNRVNFKWIRFRHWSRQLLWNATNERLNKCRKCLIGESKKILSIEMKMFVSITAKERAKYSNWHTHTRSTQSHSHHVHIIFAIYRIQCANYIHWNANLTLDHIEVNFPSTTSTKAAAVSTRSTPTAER